MLDRLTEKNYSIKFNSSVIDHISDMGYDVNFGARPLKRAIQSEVENYISEEILKGGIVEETLYSISYNKTTEKFKLTEKGR